MLDTETTDLYGAICEIAVIDACTGKTLLDTLVNPGMPITPGAAEVHGLSDAQVTADCTRYGITRTRLADPTCWADVEGRSRRALPRIGAQCRI